ncbi:hypothetical protein N483_03700 [Pseudoalteromonas luteoviolacea NCIMB 1944]|nr:hypothetical protein N483_03700 [Pseudoalteromonas luteoviolacea NCIMB 1944]
MFYSFKSEGNNECLAFLRLASLAYLHFANMEQEGGFFQNAKTKVC